MKCKLIILALALLSALKMEAQTTISGFITDAENGEALIGAHIYDRNSLSGTLSNEYGYYSLSIQGGDSISLLYSFTGYGDSLIILPGGKDHRIDMPLVPGIEVGEVKVEAQPVRDHMQPENISLPAKDVKYLPSLGGEFDLMKAFQLMPGIQSGNEGNSGLHVRGGSPDQNLILLDGVPLYYVNHLGGFISVFNPDAINSANLIKGAFPAKYGMRLSSILDLRMKEGNRKDFGVNGTIGLVSSKISVEGPIKKDTSSFIISARRFLYDLFSRPLSKYILTDGYSMGYTFYDLNGKANYKISDRDRFYISWYSGDDKSILKYMDPKVKTDKSKGIIKWGNLLASLRWNHVYNKKLFSNFSVNYTRFRFSTLVSYEQLILDDLFNYESEISSSIHDLSAKLEYQYYPADFLSLEFGSSGTYHMFRPSINSFKQVEGGVIIVDSVLNSNNVSAWEQSVYIDTKTKIYGSGILSAGVRANAYFVDGKEYIGIDPRFSFELYAGPHTSLSASYTGMMQSVHRLSTSAVGFPVDLWMPSTARVKPSLSSQWTAGISHVFNRENFSLSLDWYSKRMNNLMVYKEGAVIMGASGNWEDLVEKDGTGKSYGLEILLRKEKGKTRGWISYTYSRTTRQFANLNGGEPFPYKFDRRHDISIALMHKFNDNIDVSATWVYGTGNAITLPSGQYDIDFDPDSRVDIAYIYGSRNGFRMKPYHRLDLAVNFRKEKKWGERVWNISIYNAYNRQNPFFYFIDTEWNRNDSDEWSTTQVMKQQSLFPIIPSVSYSFTF